MENLLKSSVQFLWKRKIKTILLGILLTGAGLFYFVPPLYWGLFYLVYPYYVEWRGGIPCNPTHVFSCKKDMFCARVGSSNKGFCQSLLQGPGIPLVFPFDQGVSVQCVQGNLNPTPGRSHSSGNFGTRFAFDLASGQNKRPNWVLASHDGIAYTIGRCKTSDLYRSRGDTCPNYSGYGNMVRIDVGKGYYLQYAHLSAIIVKNGQSVVQGDIIGLEGNTGNAGPKHLHWSLHHGNAQSGGWYPSVPMEQILIRDVTWDESKITSKSWKEMVCGDWGVGDLSGHFYKSGVKAINRLSPYPTGF